MPAMIPIGSANTAVQNVSRIVPQMAGQMPPWVMNMRGLSVRNSHEIEPMPRTMM